MSSTNVLNHQAALRAPGAPRETPLLAAMRFIEGADASQCGTVAAHLAARLFALEKMHGGMQAANLNEAAHFVADAVLDIGGALQAEDDARCTCGRCDACVAGRSDEHYDRKRDGIRG